MGWGATFTLLMETLPPTVAPKDNQMRYKNEDVHKPLNYRGDNRDLGVNVKFHISTIMDRASVEDFAEKDRVDVTTVLFDHLDEGVDSYTFAQQTTDFLFTSIWQHSTEFIASTSDTGVEDDVQKLRDGLSSELGTDTAQTEVKFFFGSDKLS